MAGLTYATVAAVCPVSAVATGLLRRPRPRARGTLHGQWPDFFWPKHKAKPRCQHAVAALLPHRARSPPRRRACRAPATTHARTHKKLASPDREEGAPDPIATDGREPQDREGRTTSTCGPKMSARGREKKKKKRKKEIGPKPSRPVKPISCQADLSRPKPRIAGPRANPCRGLLGCEPA